MSKSGDCPNEGHRRPSLPEGWEHLALGTVVPKAEYGISTSLDTEGTLPVLRMNNLAGGEAELSDLKFTDVSIPSELLLKPDDVLFNRTNSMEHVGRTGIWRGQIKRATFASYLVRLVPDRKRLTPAFLNKWLNFPPTQTKVRRWATPAVQQVNVNPTNLRKTLIDLPPVPEQARITEVLDTLDEAIRGTQTQIEKNTLIYQGLQERFFSPHAIQTREGWHEARLEDFAESITSGPRGWACYYAEEGDHFLRIGNLTRKHLDLRFDDVVKVQPPAGAEGVRTALAPGDLLISITADLGIIGVVPDWMGVAYINQHIARARLIRSKANPRFVGYQLAGQLGQKQFYRLNDVGAKAGLNLPTVGRLKVWLPSLPVQNQIATALDTVQQSLRQDETLLTKLAELKSGLTSDLLTGRVRTVHT